MVALVAVCLGLALLYWWLLGHWFARLVMLPLATLPGVALGAILVQLDHPPGGFNITLGVVLGLASCWPIASIPTYYWRRRLRQLIAAQQPYRAPEYLWQGMEHLRPSSGSTDLPTRSG